MREYICEDCAVTPVSARPLASRLRNVVAFVSIVWGVAATFVAFEIVSLRGMDLALSYPAVFGSIALSPAVTQSTSCVVAGGNTRELRPSTAGVSDGRTGAWLLGLDLGRDAVFRQYAESNSPFLAELAAGSSEMAERLGVPPPAVFRSRQIASANTEFVAFVEQDAGETARRLAENLSPQACELFKLGAFWGYSEMVRPSLPGERAVFAMEIRYHALRADVPEPLWSPMLQRIPANSRPDEVLAQMTTLTEGVTTYLAGQ
jgi:hypothetical protein